MGAGQSEERIDVEALTLQQQRVQFLLLQQIQEVRQAQLRNEGGAPAGSVLSAIGGAMRPVEHPPLMITQVVRNPAHLRGKTVTLTQGQSGEPMMLRFIFDANAACAVTVYRSALLVPDLRAAWEVESAAWSSPSVLFQPGLGQEHTVEWESLFHSQALSATFESDARHCPLLVELRVEEGGEVATPSVEWTMCNLLTARGNSGKTRIEVVSQQFALGAYQALEVLEIFGSELGSDGASRQDCIVCQSEPRDTAVLPCRHMCLCHRCSDYIRTRTQYHSYKCPICRVKIGRMMRLEPSDDLDSSIKTSSSELSPSRAVPAVA